MLTILPMIKDNKIDFLNPRLIRDINEDVQIFGVINFIIFLLYQFL